MGSSPSTPSSSSSSPEPDETFENVCEKLNQLFNRSRMSDMLRVISIFSDATPEEKLQLVKAGCVKRLCAMIDDYASSDYKNRQRRQGSGYSTASSCSSTALSRGVGYGSGSTKSRWDVERTVEERIAQEEHLMWLLSALTTFLWGDSSKMSDIDVETMRTDRIKTLEASPHLCDELIDQIANESPVISLLEYHLKNDSVFDISNHVDFYSALIELAAGLSFIPAFLPYLVSPKDGNSKSIIRELIPKFRDTLNTYPSSLRGHASPDIGLMEFIRKANDLSEIIIKMSRHYEQQLPPSERVNLPAEYPRKSSIVSLPLSRSGAVRSALAQEINLQLKANPNKTPDAIYAEHLRDVQIQTHKILNDASKPIYGFSFKKELRNLNPYSSSHKDRMKRIAKELASMHSALPLNASNSFFVCMDETRCDMLKVLISGPDDTPYANGLFEFDIFFPNNYPQSPPKVSFLTTGGGTVRFNPNLYNDGKICLSILGTWEGRPEEKWNPYCSLLQVLISIQGLIFVKQPYFNEPGFEKFQGTAKGEEFSRKYNLHIENATLIYAIMDMYTNCPFYWNSVVKRHFWLKRHIIIQQAERWLHEVAREIQNNTIDPSDGENGVMEGIFVSPVVQRQNVRKLIEEFRNMKDPCLSE
ncbi:ubiquitin-conjugating enzyme domain-containing protein [Ditylenchus destructor]|nr:ubiquitin-conjugating enzyme domain-containing protein [Ditylenchus destructor]